MPTRTWLGGSGDWYTASLWTTGGAANSYPLPGDVVLINSGTVDLLGSQETTIAAVDAMQIELGSSNRASPAAIVATAATLGENTTIISSGADAFALLDAIGPTGEAGTIFADAAAGSFTIQATQAAGTLPADFVLLPSGSIVVSNGDDLILDGVITTENDVLIDAGSTLTNDGADTMLGGLVQIETGATLEGTGTFTVGADSRLQIYTAVPSTETVSFDPAGRLDLGDVTGFDGDISGFLLGNTIDLLNTVANYASYSASTDQLTIKDGTSLIAELDLQGPSSGLLATSTDGAGGTVITYPDSPTRLSLETATGEDALGANVVQQTMTTDAGAPIVGAGIKIGIMSDSFNATVDGVVDPADTAAQEGYLPATADGTSAVTVLQDSNASGVENEGLAMAELIHEVAPGAQVYFYTAEGNEDDFAAGVNSLVAAGVNIIVDDWSFSTEPYFQIAGPIDTAIENAISHGMNYFTAAGNYGNGDFQSTWQPVTTQLVLTTGRGATPQTVSAQAFDNGTPLQTVTIFGDQQTTFDLQWAVPWPSAGGSVPDQLGMALYTMSGQLVAVSQQVSDEPVYGALPEISLTAPETSGNTQYQLAIYQIGTVPVTEFKYIMLGSPGASTGDGASTEAQNPGGIVDDSEAGQGSGSVQGHQLVPGVNTVGATYWANAPAYGVPPDWTEYYSDSGPGTLLFDQNGQPYSTPVSAGKVDFVAPDGIDTSLPGYQLFFGTSAAAPDAAAVAALMLQADPDLTPAQVTSMLEASAVSLGLPAAEQGAGLVQAAPAVALAIAASGSSATFVWVGASSSNIASGANWDDVTRFMDPASSPPGVTDTAQFLNSGGTLNGTDTVSIVQFGSGGLWALGPSTTLGAENSITVGSGVVAIGSGATVASEGTVDTISGTGGVAGAVAVSGVNALWNSAGMLVVGDGGLGELSITDEGTVVSGAGVVANMATAAGSSVDVSGDGSDWLVGGLLDVGHAGAASLDITVGGTVFAGTLVAAAQSGADGVISISGNNSSLITAGTLSVGTGGAGELSILSGANVNIGGDFDIGTSAGASGNVDIEDTSGTVFVGGNLNLGVNGGVAVLTVGYGSTLEVDNGGVNGGPNAVLIPFSPIDPFYSNGVTYPISSTQVQSFPAYVADSRFNLSQGVTYTLETPAIYAGSGFEIGAGTSDTEPTELVLNAGSFSANSSVTFESAVGTLVVGVNALATIATPISGTSSFTKVVNPDAGVPLIGSFDGTLKQFQAGDVIIVDTSVAATFSQSGSIVSVIANGTTLGVLTFDSVGAATAATSSGLENEVVAAPCFAAGTRIATARGEVAVEDLAVGDRVPVVLGEDEAEIIWIGQRSVNCARHPKPASVWPVRIAAGAFGPGQPHTELWLSPDHAVYVNDVLIPVRHLINGTTIVQVKMNTVTYYHLELPRHDVLLAEGLAVESYLDMKDGSNYANRPGPVRLYPDFSTRMWEAFGCARLVVTGAELEAARAILNQTGMDSKVA